MILGAGHFMIPAIKTANDMDLCVIVTDGNTNAEGFKHAHYHESVDFSNIEKILGVAKKYTIDGIIPLNDYGVKTAAVIAEEMGLCGITPETAELCINKRLMREKWGKSGLPCPKFKAVHDFHESEKVAEEFGYPIITKPPDTMGGSRGVIKIDTKDELKKAFNYAISFTRQNFILIEEYVTGYECSVESISYEGKINVLAISDKTKLPPPYRVDKSVTFPTKHSTEIQEEIQSIAKKAISSLGIKNGASHLELSITENGVRLFEIGARTGGGGIIAAIQVPIVYGVNMMREAIRIALGEPPDFVFNKTLNGSDFRFLTPSPGVVKSVSGVEKALSLKNVVTGACFVNSGDLVHSIQSGSDRSGYIVTRGATRDDAIRIADMAENLIKIETNKPY